MKELITAVVVTILTLGGIISTNSSMDSFEPAPPVEVARLVGEVRQSQSNLVGTSPRVTMVLTETDTSEVATAIDDAWARDGWSTEAIADSSGITITGQMEDVAYAARLERVGSGVRVRIWRNK